MNVIFDLDGVLVDTREAVRQAYQDAGVEMHPSVWGRPWQEWLPDAVGSIEKAKEIHEAKDRFYELAIDRNHVTSLPPMELLRVLDRSNLAHVGILTGASRVATLNITRKFQLHGVQIYGTSMTKKAKFETLWGIASRGVYIDDQDISVPFPWRLVRFDPQNETLDELMEELWTP